MAYIDDINTLSPEHVWTFDGAYTDAVGSVDGTNTGTIVTDSGICVNATNCMTTNSKTDDRVVIPDTIDINNSSQARKAIGGWIRVTAIQPPPKRIYGEGGTTPTFQFVMAYGNNILLEVASGAATTQVYGIPCVPNRSYHILGRFLGTAYGDVVEFFIDGVKMPSSVPTDGSTGLTTLPLRTPAEFGDPAGIVGLGGDTLLMEACTNGRYGQWASWGDSANAQMSNTDIREILFEKGAIPDLVITNQAGLDAISDTLRPNSPLCIQVTGNGTIDLDADNVTFDPLASIHIQYTGTGVLNWTNSNGSNASIVSTTSSGAVNIINPASLTITGLIVGSEVRIYDNEVVNDGNNDTELAGIENTVGSTFVYNHSGVTNTVVMQIMASGYVEIKQEYVVGAIDEALAVFPETEIN